ncbi:MAG: M20 family peptidase, partial [Solirubrobacterales bacterium]
MVDDAATRAVLQALDPGEVLADARALLAAPSENPGGTEEEVARVAVEILTDLGAAPEVVRGEAG